MLGLACGCVRAGFEPPDSSGPVPDMVRSDVPVSDGPEDGTTVEAGDQGPAGLCAGFTGILCDDFESDLSQWTVAAYTGTVGITSGAARTGQGGLHVTLDGNGLSGVAADFAPVTGGPVYISAWVRLSATPKLTDWLVIMELREDPWAWQKVSLDGEYDDRFQMNVTTDPTTLQSSPGELPRGTWACLEMYVDVADSGSAWIQVDGKRLEKSGIDTLPDSGMFNQMLIGLSTAAQALSADFDDVRIGTQVYGCSGQGK